MQQTPLHYAACNYEIEVVRFLVSVGCNVLAVDDRGQTAVDAIKVRLDLLSFMHKCIAPHRSLNHFGCAGQRRFS